MLPNFFIVGAPKAGTTSLYDYLDQHPQIYMSPIKEPCYFASELRPENYSEEIQPWITGEMESLKTYLDGPMDEKRFGGLVTEWDDYLKLFRNAQSARAIGEASVCYLWSPTAARNIFAAVRAAKIIMILRNPIDRAFSQYMHAVTLGATRKSFREQIDASLRSRNGTFGKLYPFLDFGLYSQQVKRYLDLFSRENVRIYFYEDYRDKPLEMLADIFQFLDVDATFQPSLSQRRLEPRIPRSLTLSYFLSKYTIGRLLRKFLRPIVFKPRQSVVMNPEDQAYLRGYYQEDIRNLSTLLSRDLQIWTGHS